jgi:DNA-directed RNA polymerase subunit H (RpoH/RPB5)
MNIIRFNTKQHNIKQNHIYNHEIMQSNINTMMLDRQYIYIKEIHKKSYMKLYSNSNFVFTYFLEHTENIKYTSMSDIINILEEIKENYVNKLETVILVLPLKLNKQNMRIIHNLKQSGKTKSIFKWYYKHNINIELFTHNEMIDSPVRNCLSCLYRKVSPSEKMQILNNINLYHIFQNEKDVHKSQSIARRLPVMFLNDRIARHYKYEHGDIIKIIRDFPSEIYYRIIVDYRKLGKEDDISKGGEIDD